MQLLTNKNKTSSKKGKFNIREIGQNKK